MKNTSIISALSLVLFLTSACLSERHLVPEGWMNIVESDSITIVASLEQGITKTALGENLSVVWNEGDQIRVYNASTPAGKVYTLKAASAGQTQGDFSGPSMSGPGPFYAVYPANAAGTLSGSTIALNLPSNQTVAAAGNFGTGANIAVGMAADISEIYFKNLCGLLAVTVKGSQSIEQIRVTADGGELLSGSGIVNVSLAEDPTLELTSGSSSVSLNMSSATALSSEGKTFYVVVPAGSLADGFAVEIADSEGGAMVKHAADDGSNLVQRATVKPMPALVYSSDVNRAWLDQTQAGVYSGVQPGQTVSSLITLSEANGQYAWGPNTSSPYMYRIQDWDAGYVVSLSLQTASLTLGKPFSADITAMGATNGLSSVSGVTMKVFRVKDGLIWLSDGTNGFIMKAEEE